MKYLLMALFNSILIAQVYYIPAISLLRYETVKLILMNEILKNKKCMASTEFSLTFIWRNRGEPIINPNEINNDCTDLNNLKPSLNYKINISNEYKENNKKIHTILEKASPYIKSVVNHELEWETKTGNKKCGGKDSKIKIKTATIGLNAMSSGNWIDCGTIYNIETNLKKFQDKN